MKTSDGKDIEDLVLHECCEPHMYLRQEPLGLGHFSWSEVACHETGELPPSWAIESRAFACFVGMLNMVRAHEPLIVNSWYRSPKHPIEANKPLPGPHTSGLAADLRVSGIRAVSAIRMACHCSASDGIAPWLGLGVSQTGPHRFVHVDYAGDPDAACCDPTAENPRVSLRHLRRPNVWSY